MVGAGPAGAMITKELAERKFSVLCIEKEIEVGYTNKSTAATPMDTFETFDIPRELAFENLCGARIFGPSTSCTLEFSQVVGRVLNFRAVKQYLIKEAIKSGAHTILGTTVKSGLVRKGELVGIRYKGFFGEGTLTANVVVDASGPESTLAVPLGLWQKKPEQLGVAFEYFLENAKPDKGKLGYFLDFFMGSKRAPGGYGWIFPTGEHEVKGGVCKLNPTFSPPNELSQKEYFEKIWREDHQIKDAQPFEIHQCAHYITGAVEQSALDNFVAVGDAVNKVHPIFGEGVRSSFYSARFAAEAIDQARKRKDYSAKSLSLYDELWKKKWGTNWRFSTIAYKALYSANDERLDSMIDSMQKMDHGILERLYLGKATRRDYLSLLKTGSSLVDKKDILAIIARLRN